MKWPLAAIPRANTACTEYEKGKLSDTTFLPGLGDIPYPYVHLALKVPEAASPESSACQ